MRRELGALHVVGSRCAPYAAEVIVLALRLLVWQLARWFGARPTARRMLPRILDDAAIALERVIRRRGVGGGLRLRPPSGAGRVLARWIRGRIDQAAAHAPLRWNALRVARAGAVGVGRRVSNAMMGRAASLRGLPRAWTDKDKDGERARERQKEWEEETGAESSSGTAASAQAKAKEELVAKGLSGLADLAQGGQLGVDAAAAAVAGSPRPPLKRLKEG